MGVGSFGALIAGPGALANEEWPDSLPVDNGSSVENNNVPPQVDAPTPGTYAQPGTEAPSPNSLVTVGGLTPPVSAIAVEEGSNYVQANTQAPAANPQVTVGGSVNGNPMGL